MIISDFQPFNGQHCETTATGSLLAYLGIELSEPMLFGLGSGLGYIFWRMKGMDFPFIGGRVKPDVLTKNICRHLNCKLEVKETNSISKAWQNVVKELDAGVPVGLKLDCYHLEYFTNKIHFAGHYVSMYGYDDEFAYLNDTNQQSRQARTSLESLALARNERGPMASRNRSYTIQLDLPEFDLDRAILTGIRKNVQEYLNPPIRNLYYKGIFKTSQEIISWYDRSPNRKAEFITTAMLMERAGTGGALFRNLYRDFLWEAAEQLNIDRLGGIGDKFNRIARNWTQVSRFLHQAGEKEDASAIREASSLLVELSQLEHSAMSSLQRIVI